MQPAKALVFVLLITAGVVACAHGEELTRVDPSTPKIESQHPLKPVIKKAEDCLDRIDNEIGDYTCTLVKRERTEGKISKHSYAFVKVRHEGNGEQAPAPFSVYMRFDSPADVRGREVLYVEGRNKGKLIARNGGKRRGHVTVAISPTNSLAMRESHYPITEMGIRNLVERLLEVGEEDLQHGEIDVKYYTGAKINGRTCTAIEVTHPTRRDHFRYHVSRIFIDDELQLPVRFASYDWPDEPDGSPKLIEEFTYLDIKLNVGLSERDFDYRNDEYRFEKDVDI